MAKKLKELKAKLGELQGPEDNTVATKNFYRKHKTVEHPDPAGNGDDVFKASNVRTVKRSPDHGYEPGEDAAVYEDVGGYSDVDIKRQETHIGAAKAAKAQRRVVDDEGFKKDDRPRWDSAKDEVKAGTQASSRKGLAIASSERARRNLRLQKNSYEPQGNKIDEILGFSKKEKAEKAAKKMMNSGPWKKAMDAKKKVDAARYYGILKQSYDPKIAEIFEHLSEENKKHFIDILGEENGYERIAEAFGLAEEE
jgi:hypothetical protein